MNASYGLNPKPSEAKEFFPLTSMGFDSGLNTICHYKMHILDHCPPQKCHICTQSVYNQIACTKPKNPEAS